MKFCKILMIGVALLAAVSCSTPKDIVYFQDMKPGETELAVTAPVEIKVRAKDKLSIIVSTQDEKLSELFNLSSSNQQTSQTGVKLGYTVDTEGYINFPVLGKLKLAGMTREQIAEYITNELKTRELVKDPVVIVDFMNLSVSVLGEVSSPGRYDIDRDNYTVLNAISAAGDLSINGRRGNVKVLRAVNGKQTVYEMNLCDASTIYSSPAYYLQQDDVIYVEPNANKARQSTVNGNTLLTPAFWMSAVSFLMSIVVLVVK